jgi:hypothetical protein
MEKEYGLRQRAEACLKRCVTRGYRMKIARGNTGTPSHRTAGRQIFPSPFRLRFEKHVSQRPELLPQVFDHTLEEGSVRLQPMHLMLVESHEATPDNSAPFTRAFELTASRRTFDVRPLEDSRALPSDTRSRVDEFRMTYTAVELARWRTGGKVTRNVKPLQVPFFRSRRRV